jgi:catechol 2,3-dioxygenase
LFLSAGGYHHHLGTNVWSPGPAPTADQAQLLAWDLIVPSPDDVSRAARSLRDAGYQFAESENDLTVADPWGTRLRVRVPA